MASVDRSNAASSSASTTFTRDILEDIIRMQRDVMDRSKAYLHDDTKLSQGELVWRDRYVWLKERGYQLRSRYSPDWKPSWLNKGENESGLGAEDGGAFSYTAGHLIDATRISDGRAVVLKGILKKKSPDEAEIAQFLSSEPLRSDPRNHCVPILDVLDDPVDNQTYIVMPMLVMCNIPFFQTVGEVVAFFQQALEGLQFMHQHNVAHRDAMFLSIMMDQSMWPEPRHHIFLTFSRDGTRQLKLSTRTERSPKYYWTDFSLSRRYDPEAGPRREKPAFSGDDSAPEHQGSLYEVPCDPMPTDVYYVGNLIRVCFLKEYANLGFMHELVNDMVRENPVERPTMDEVVEHFTQIRGRLHWWEVRAPLMCRTDEPVDRRIWRARDVFRTARYILKGLSAIPVPGK